MNTLAAPRLPLAIEEIDADWVTDALRPTIPGIRVEKLDVVNVINGTCTKIRLRLQVNDAGRAAGLPETLMFKGGFEKHSREMGYMLEYEVRGYREVLDALDLPHPKCWFAQFDPERQQSAILMEDLVASDVRFCNPLKPEGYDDAALRLEVLAEFHAKTWNSPAKLRAGKWGSLGDYIRNTHDYAHAIYLIPDVWQRFIDSPRGASASTAFHTIPWMSDALKKNIILSETLPHAVVHGDTHLGNLYVAKDGTPGFFDSLPMCGPVMSEVSYHMVCALDTLTRPRWERALVAHYLGALRSHGIQPPTLDEAMFQYSAFLARAYWVFVINESFFQPEAVNTAYVARISAAMIDNDTIGVLNSIS